MLVHQLDISLDRSYQQTATSSSGLGLFSDCSLSASDVCFVFLLLLFYFIFPFFVQPAPSLCFNFPSSFRFFSSIHTSEYHAYAPGVIRLQMIRDDIPQLVNTVSLTDWYDTTESTILCLILVCFLPSTCNIVAACFVITGRISGRKCAN